MQIATDAELRSVAKAIRTRGIPKALRALEATRRYHRGCARGAPDNERCNMCRIYRPAHKRHCGLCPGTLWGLCSRVSDYLGDCPTFHRHSKVAKLCTRLMRFIRAEQKRRERQDA